MAAIKTIIELILIFSISRPDLLCFGFCLNNHNARNRYPKMVMASYVTNLLRVLLLQLHSASAALRATSSFAPSWPGDWLSGRRPFPSS